LSSCRLIAKGIVKLLVDREEALSVARRLEAAHGAFPLPRGLVGVFGPVVQTFVAAMFNTRHDLLVRRL
jgi:hypothetical protein